MCWKIGFEFVWIGLVVAWLCFALLRLRVLNELDKLLTVTELCKTKTSTRTFGGDGFFRAPLQTFHYHRNNVVLSR